MVFDPGTMFLVSQGAGIVSDIISNQNTQSASSDMMKTIEESAGKFLEQSEDMMSIARYFQPGGGAFRDIEQSAIDTAFTTAQKGSEDLRAKGVNMTSYGMGTAADIIKESFTKNLMDDYKSVASTGVQYSQLGLDSLKQYGDYMTTGAQAEFMGATSGVNPFGSLIDVFSDPDSIKAINTMFNPTPTPSV